MQSVRAYNMNLNELIDPELAQTSVRNHNIVTNDNQKTKISGNDVISLSDVAGDEGVFVDISPVWKKAAKTIDLRNATTSEVADLSAKLFNDGAISFEDHVNLSFQKDPFSTEKMDVLAFWNDQQEKVIQRGALHHELNDIIRIQSILAYVESLGGQ